MDELENENEKLKNDEQKYNDEKQELLIQI